MRNPRVLVLDGSQSLFVQVNRAASSLRPRAEVVHCAGLDALAEVIDDRGPFDVVIAGPMASSDEGLFAIRRVRVHSPQTSVILAFDRWRNGTLRNTVRTGAVDLLRLPVDDGVILDAIEEAQLAIRWPEPVETVAGDTRHAPDGRVIVVGSATGGCGKTFYSTNLAYYLRAHLNKRTILIDLDLQFGELSTALRLKPRHTIADLVAHDDTDEAFAARLEEYVVSHETGVCVLAAPEGPAEADAMDANDISRVIAAAASRFDFVVVDSPAALSEGVLSAIEGAERIFSIATLDLPSVRNLGVLLTTLNQLKVPSERIQLVLNKVEHDVGMDVATVERYFPQGFVSVIPYGRAVNRSLNMGMPMLAFVPRSEVSRALLAGFAASLDVEGAEAGLERAPRQTAPDGPAMTLPLVAVLAGLALMVVAVVAHRQAQQRAMDELIAITPFPLADEGEAGVEGLAFRAVELAGHVVERVDRDRSLRHALDRARIPLRPGEFVLTVGCAALGIVAFILLTTASWPVAILGGLGAIGFAYLTIRRRIAKRRRAFETQLPDAFGLIASSLTAGHTFLRAIQMMCEESAPPLSEEFGLVVSETQLGASLVDSLERMSDRVQVRDMDMAVQAIRIQQTIGGRLADLLHTLADFIRARDEVRREVQVLTAEGRTSAYVLTGLVPFLFISIQLMNPAYLEPLWHGWGLGIIVFSVVSVLLGLFVILRMVRIDI